MLNETESHVRIPGFLDAATYVSIAAMSVLGISGLTSWRTQIIALGLIVIFAVLYRFVFQAGRYEQNPSLYFGVQVTTLAFLFLLGSSNNDAFNFLFVMLCIHAAVVLPARIAIFWIVLCYGVVAAITLLLHGTAGLYAAFFYAITFIICGFFGSALRQTEQARDHNLRLLEKLQSTQQKLQELAVVEERNRLARDLHDSVKQQVFAISMQLSAARTTLSESDKAYQSVTEAERLAQQAGAELTTLINALRPPGLESKTLATAVREHVEEWSRQNKISIETNIDSSISLHQQSEQALFRVLQEALANVARHSKADKVTVDLSGDEKTVTLSIADNGVGFDSKQIAKGIGLDSMQERLIAVNGKVEVLSEKSKGTRVVAKVRRS